MMIAEVAPRPLRMLSALFLLRYSFITIQLSKGLALYFNFELFALAVDPNTESASRLQPCNGVSKSVCLEV